MSEHGTIEVKPPHERDYIERTIETVRVHRNADNCWPQWANIFADQIEWLEARLVSLTEERKQLEARLADLDRARADRQSIADLRAGLVEAYEEGAPGDIEAIFNVVAARLVQAEEALRGMQPDVDALLGTTDRVGLTEQPGNTLPDEVFNLACAAKEAFRALRSLGDTPEKAEDIGGNTVARSKTERSAS